ncbi:unnamed protein product, partial [Notodromas monacha]
MELWYIHAARADPDNVFAIAFKTPPVDSKGSAHVLEHYVLAGSEQFPVSNPFLKMMTRVDYQNLRNVYVDLVMHPLLKEADFLQEAWRIEPQDMNYPDSPLELRGVVYTEMKSIRENAQSWFARDIRAALLPDTVYAHNSGGNPDDIPQLTWDGVRRFHNQHYGTANAKVFSYGDLALEDHLNAMNQLVQ